MKAGSQVEGGVLVFLVEGNTVYRLGYSAWS